MAKIRIGATTKLGVYKNVVLNMGREVKIGIGYVTDTRLEQSYLNTLEKVNLMAAGHMFMRCRTINTQHRLSQMVDIQSSG